MKMKMRHRTCARCGKRWNVSAHCWPDSHEYICPVCARAAALRLMGGKA